MLRESDLYLPAKGWGGSCWPPPPPTPGGAGPTTAPPARNAASSTADNETRTIPIPPELVKLLRAHIKKYGTSPDGRVFQTTRGGIIQDSAYSAVWAEARKMVVTEAQFPSARPPSLRPAARGGVAVAELGVPATEVARRAGHGVAVLLKIYAHCIDGQADAANQRITGALSIQDSEPAPDREEDGDGEQAS
jgi:integrase